MLKNILFAIGGVLTGFVVGFLITNNLSSGAPALNPETTAAAITSSARAAPPLDPSRVTGTLPPNHPTIGGETGSATETTTAAANSMQAQSAMERADRTRTDFDAQMSAAATFYQLGDYDKAALYLARALELKPQDADALVAMGDTQYDAGKFTEAAAYYERTLKERPQDTNARTDLGNTYFKRTPPDYRRAVEHYRQSLTIDPRHEKTLQNIALAFLNLGDRNAAREHITQLAAVNPQNPALASLRSAANDER